MTGLFITLGEQKATLFYLGFFPAFIDIYKISYFDTIIIIAITIVTGGGVKLGYVFMADRARSLISSKITKGLNIAAGCVTIAVGLFLSPKSISLNPLTHRSPQPPLLRGAFRLLRFYPRMAR